MDGLKGGIVTWGIVPTSVARGVFPDPAEIVHQWVDRYHELLKKGGQADELKGRSFFSTSCSLGNGRVSVCEKAVRCLTAFVSFWGAGMITDFKE